MLDWILNILFPPTCPVCGKYIEDKGTWCSSCLRAVSRPRRLPLAAAMHSCFDRGVWTLGVYEDKLRDIIRQIKYDKKKALLPGIHSLVAMGLEELQSRPELSGILGSEAGETLVIPVPLHAKRLKERGFNQSSLMFREPMAAIGIEMQEALQRIRETRPQFGLNAQERRENMQEVFSVAHPEGLQGKNIILVDDIMTTGATLQSCALELRKAGIGRLMGLTVASGRK